MEHFMDVEFVDGEDIKTKIIKMKTAIKKNEIYRQMFLQYIEGITNIKEKESDFKEENIESLPFSINEKEDSSLDVSSYIYNILHFNSFQDEEDLYDYLKEVLPSRNEISNYTQIVNAILVQLLIEKNEWIETRFQMRKEREDESEILLYDEMILEIQKIIDTIISIRDEKVVDVVDKNVNHLIFLTRGSKVCFEEDIENMPLEYGLRLQKLLLSIKDNTFWYKNYRMFNSNNKKITSAIEVKGFQTRILISRIDVNTYVVIGAFIKKSNWGKNIFQIVSNKLAHYEIEKEKILTLYQKDRNQYLKQNQDILLGLESKIKAYVKKGGI